MASTQATVGTEPSIVSAEFVQRHMATTAIAYRGYNVTNLGRTPELLSHPAYASTMSDYLARGSQLCSDVLGYDVDLVTRVREQRETSMATYGEALTMIVAVSLAQLELLRTNFGVEYTTAQFGFGYSLGEVTAVIAGGLVSMEEALRTPLELSGDCVALAHDVTLAVLFSRTSEIPLARVDQLCQSINEEQNGVIGISTILSPNSILLMGQGTTLDRFAQRMSRITADRLFLRRNEHRWPPLHTPIVWQRNIPCRSKVRLQSMTIQHQLPQPSVFSLVTGQVGYQQGEIRSLMGDWIDHPQNLWAAIEYVLMKGVTDIIHVGPSPNIIPATLDRLAQNVTTQVRSSGRIMALSQIARRPWLQRLLPRKTNLLRAPQIRQHNLEDWLLAHPRPGK